MSLPHWTSVLCLVIIPYLYLPPTCSFHFTSITWGGGYMDRRSYFHPYAETKWSLKKTEILFGIPFQVLLFQIPFRILPFQIPFHIHSWLKSCILTNHNNWLSLGTLLSLTTQRLHNFLPPIWKCFVSFPSLLCLFVSFVSLSLSLFGRLQIAMAEAFGLHQH